MFVRRVLPLVAWLITACVDGQGPSFEPYCRALCDLEKTCSNEFDLVRTPAMERQCQRECLTDPYTEVTREDALRLAEECFAERSCESDRQETEEVVTWLTQQANTGCLTEASAEIEPSKACQQFCEDFAALPGCSTNTVAACLGTYCAFEDDVVEERRDCFDLEDCTERRICFEIARD